MNLSSGNIKEIECWLYFGMLFYVFGENLNQVDFLLSEEISEESEDDDLERPKHFLTTTHLRDMWITSRSGRLKDAVNEP